MPILARIITSLLFLLFPQRATFFGQNTVSATTVTQNGTGYSVTSSGAHVITLASGVSPGVGVVAITYAASAGTPVSACTDNGSGGSNTWTVESASPTTASIINQPCSAFINHSITTITVTTSVTAFIRVFVINHFASSSWADVNAGNDTNFGTSTTATTGAVSQKDVVFAACIASGGASGLGVTSGYTNLYNDSNVARVETAGWLEKVSGTAAATCGVSSNKALSLFVQAYKE